MKNRRIVVALAVVVLMSGGAIGYWRWASRGDRRAPNVESEKQQRSRHYRSLVRRIRAGGCEGVFDEIEAFRARYPKLGAAWNLKAYCLEQRGEDKKALALYREALRRSPKHLMFLSNVAKSCFRLDRIGCSLKMLRRIRGISKRQALVIQHLVTSPALEPYKPTHFEGRHAKSLALAVGYLEASHRVVRALPLLQAALKENPDDLVVLLNLAVYQGKLGRWVPAKEYLRRCLTVAAKSGITSKRDARTLALQRIRAVILHRSGDYATATKAYRIVLTIDPHHRGALYGLAAALFNQGKKSDALDEYKKLKALDAKLSSRLFRILSADDR
ncbi:MAG: tetratricopeptide repeat protein [Myxococcales bacterium]|nr:tetratricopeptide repeat protein [Myxococcales bacterium]